MKKGFQIPQNQMFGIVLNKYINNWKSVVCLVLLFLIMGVAYLCMRVPLYERTATILYKESNSSMSSVLINSYDLGKNQYYVNLANEFVLASSTQALITVIRKLNLNTQYCYKGFFKDDILYGEKLPYKINIINEDYDMEFSFDMYVNGDSVNFFDINDEKENLSCMIGDTVLQSWGGIVIEKNDNFKGNIDSRLIHVIHEPVFSIAGKMTKLLSTSMCNNYAIAVNVNFRDQCIERANDVLNELINEYLCDEEKINGINKGKINERINNVELELDSIYNKKNSSDDSSLEYKKRGKEALYLYLLEKKEDYELTLCRSLYDSHVIMPPEACGKNNPVNYSAKRVLFFSILLGLILPFLVLYLKENYQNQLDNLPNQNG